MARRRPLPAKNKKTKGLFGDRPWLWGGLAAGVAVLLAVLLAVSVTGGSGDGGSRVGQTAPDFTLPEVDGGTMQLSDFRGERVVLVFYRTYTWGFCREQLVGLQKVKDQIEDLGGNLIALSVDPLQGAAILKEGLGLTYPVLADSDAAVSREYQIFNLLGDGLSAPAVYVIDEDGVIQWRYIGTDFTDRPGEDEVLDALRRLDGWLDQHETRREQP